MEGVSKLEVAAFRPKRKDAFFRIVRVTYVGAATAAAHRDNAASARPIIMLSSSSVENQG